MFFDALESKADINGDILNIIALLTVTAAARIIFIEAGGRLDILHRFSMSALLRRNMLEDIFKKPGALHGRESMGEIINCFRDDAGQAEDSISWTLDILGDAVFALSAIIILVNINVKMTLFVFAPLVLVVAAAQSAGNKIEKNRKDSRQATGNVSGAIGELFSSVQAVKVAGAEKHVLEHLKKLNAQRQRTMLRDSMLTQIMDSIFENTVNLGTGLILILSSKYMKVGSFTVGDFALFIYYLTFVADFTQFFGSFIAHYQQTCVSYARMSEILGKGKSDILVAHNPIYLKGKLPEDKEVCIDDKGLLNKIQIKNLSYHYLNTDKGIEEISFTVDRGNFVVVTGRIGSGKSTLLKVLLGLLPRESGEIIYNERIVNNPEEFFIPPYSAYTSQVPNLFSDTLKKNILYGLSEENTNIDDAVRCAVLSEDVKSLDSGLETIIGPKGVKLSGGQIQRTAIARMFARNAQMYVLDDISSALDVETEKKLWEQVNNKKNSSFIVVSNRRWALERADHIIVLKDGKIESQGSLEELLNNCEEFRQIYG
jgi:ATP-binding cassette subfamily B protein